MIVEKRVFIVHGWGGYPKEGWFPWLKKELTKKGFDVNVLKMPETQHPKIKLWTSFLKKNVGKLNNNAFFVGHSIGCQTILRYLEKENKKCGGIILVAPWIYLNMTAIEEEGKESVKIANAWIKKPIDFVKIKKLKIKFVSVFSDNDEWVTLDNLKVFEKELYSNIIVMHKKGHFSGEDKVKKLPVVLKELLDMAKKRRGN